MRTVISDSDSMRLGESNAKNLSLSQASLALEINSLRKFPDLNTRNAPSGAAAV